MAESLFDIFGDHLTRQAVKNVSRQPLSNNENMGKTVSTGPLKPNQPMKKVGENKKSFLSNTGKALQSTPMRKVFSPRINVGNLIYNDEENEHVNKINMEEFEFTRPTYKYDNYHKDVFDYLPIPEPPIVDQFPLVKTPPPSIKDHSLETLDCSYEDDFFKDDFTCDSFQDDDLNLPDLY